MAGLTETARRKLLIAARAGLGKGKCEKTDSPIEHIRFRSPIKGIERGTVICEGGAKVIYGYPHIKRVYTLEAGLARNMPPGKVYAEEKIDGFNVRIASIEGRIHGFSRGGFLDPFVTEKARDMGLDGFFAAHPDHVIYGEMIGNTPYTEPTDGYDVRLYVFDIGRGDGTLLACEERYGMIRDFGLPGVPLLKHLDRDDTKGFRSLALALEKGGNEGMVIKSASGPERVKYVTAGSDIRDVAEASDIMFDMPIGFYHQRLLRSAFFMRDMSLGRKAYAKRMGEAFYEGILEALDKAASGEMPSAEFEILVKDPSIWEGIRRHMSKEVGLELLWKREEKGRTRMRFLKIYKRTGRMLASLARGKAVID